MPVLELTTIGRKSGERRSVMLTSPYQEGDTLVIVASRRWRSTAIRLGSSISEANPAVEVSTKGTPNQKMNARLASPQKRSNACPNRRSEQGFLLERTTGFEPATLTLARSWCWSTWCRAVH